jgi:hypothetical protein
VAFTHPLLRTTALDRPRELVVQVAGGLLDRLDVPGGSTSPGTLSGCPPRDRTGSDHHRDLVKSAFAEAIEHGSWSAAATSPNSS